MLMAKTTVMVVDVSLKTMVVLEVVVVVMSSIIAKIMMMETV
jgi:hypothetical protein